MNEMEVVNRCERIRLYQHVFNQGEMQVLCNVTHSIQHRTERLDNLIYKWSIGILIKENIFTDKLQRPSILNENEPSLTFILYDTIK